MVEFRPDQLSLEVTPREWKVAVQKAMAAEGVTLGQWQSMPVPEQDVFKARTGYGKGCPWSCPFGRGDVQYHSSDYQQYVAEHVEPWSYLKFPFLKKIGWKGFVDGVDSGVYKATPLARLNAAEGMATPLAQSEYE